MRFPNESNVTKKVLFSSTGEVLQPVFIVRIAGIYLPAPIVLPGLRIIHQKVLQYAICADMSKLSWNIAPSVVQRKSNTREWELKELRKSLK